MQYDAVFELYDNFKLHELYILLRSLSHAHIDDCLENVDDCCRGYSHKASTVTLLLLAYRSRFIAPIKKLSKDENVVYCPIPFMHW